MNSAQQRLFQLLCEVDDLCKKNRIEYYLAYETLLGAVTEEAFLKESDMVDISMTEKNYNKFVKVCEKELRRKKRVFCDNRRNRECPSVSGRYIDQLSCRITPETMFWDEYCGYYIRISCMVELPGDQFARQTFYNRYMAYDEYVNRSYLHDRRKPFEIMEEYRSFQEKEAVLGREQVLSKVESMIFDQHFEDAKEYLICSEHLPVSGLAVPKQAYSKTRFGVLEGRKFPLPGDYVELLWLWFGNRYDPLGIHEERQNDRADTSVYKEKSVAESIEHVPCRAYVEEALRFIDRETLLNSLARAKDAAVEEAAKYTEFQEDYCAFRARMTEQKLKLEISRDKISTAELLIREDEASIKILMDLFREYHNINCNDAMKYWHKQVELDDGTEYTALYVLYYYLCDYNGTEQILKNRQDNNRKMTRGMEDLAEALSHQKDGIKALVYEEDHSLESVLKWLEEHDSRHPNTLFLRQSYDEKLRRR